MDWYIYYICMARRWQEESYIHMAHETPTVPDSMHSFCVVMSFRTSPHNVPSICNSYLWNPFSLLHLCGKTKRVSWFNNTTVIKVSLVNDWLPSNGCCVYKEMYFQWTDPESCFYNKRDFFHSLLHSVQKSNHKWTHTKYHMSGSTDSSNTFNDHVYTVNHSKWHI